MKKFLALFSLSYLLDEASRRNRRTYSRLSNRICSHGDVCAVGIERLQIGQFSFSILKPVLETISSGTNNSKTCILQFIT